MKTSMTFFFLLALLVSIPGRSQDNPWILIDDFESPDVLDGWTLADPENETDPKVEGPQVTEIRTENGNRFLFKKPAAEGVVGNRKAVTFKKLPVAVPVGEIWTLYLRLRVEHFPNNHVLGLGNVAPEVLLENVYNGFEPSLRVTDRLDRQLPEKNDGTLMVRKDPWYDHIQNFKENRKARPMEIGVWYDIWCVIDNRTLAEGGQKYEVYIQGGEEFPAQQKVYEGADFRMKRERPLSYFQATCNTGPVENPYGNGGLMYDDLYLSEGANLQSPTN